MDQELTTTPGEKWPSYVCLSQLCAAARDPIRQREIMHEAWGKLRSERGENLVTLARQDLAFAMASATHDGITKLHAGLGGISTALSSNFMVDGGDEQNPMQALRATERNLIQLSQRIGELFGAESGFGERTMQNIDMSTMFYQTMYKFAPGMMLKNLQMNGGPRGEHTFESANEDSLRRIVEEMVFSAIDSSPSKAPIEFYLGSDDAGVYVTAVDAGEAMNGNQVFEFNRGGPVERSHPRLWHLSFARSAATNLLNATMNVKSHSGRIAPRNIVHLNLPR